MLFYKKILVLILILSSVVRADIWNIDANTIKIWLNHSVSFVDRTLYLDGEVNGPITNDDSILQYSALSLTYSPTFQTHFSVYTPLEKKKDDTGRPIASTLEKSFDNYHLPLVILEGHFGLTDSLYTHGIGFFYHLPVENIVSRNHTLGVQFSTYFILDSLNMTLISTTALAGGYTPNAFTERLGGYVSERIEIYHDINPTIQGHYLVEGLYSTWYYIKFSLGAYFPIVDSFKVGLHYTKVLLGKWVLPSDSIELSLEYKFNW